MSQSGTAEINKAWRLRFLERLGLYLLVGPLVASLTILLLGLLLDGPPEAPGLQNALLLTLVIYLVALPIVLLYAFLLDQMLGRFARVGPSHVALCAFLVSLLLHSPALVLGAPSDGQIVGPGYYMRAFVFLFLAIFAAGLVCWRIAPGLHRKSP